jgi:hypothetical protein
MVDEPKEDITTRLAPAEAAPAELEALRLELAAAVERLLHLVSIRVAEAVKDIESEGNA